MCQNCVCRQSCIFLNSGTFNISVIEGNSREEQLIVVCNNLKYISTVLILTSYLIKL